MFLTSLLLLYKATSKSDKGSRREKSEVHIKQSSRFHQLQVKFIRKLRRGRVIKEAEDKKRTRENKKKAVPEN